MSIYPSIFNRPCTEQLLQKFTSICRQVVENSSKINNQVINTKFEYHPLDPKEDALYLANAIGMSGISDDFSKYKEITEYKLSVYVKECEFSYIAFATDTVPLFFVLFVSNEFYELIATLIGPKFTLQNFPIFENMIDMDFDSIFGLNGKLSSLDALASGIMPNNLMN